MREVTSLHVIPYHPENYKTIYVYDIFLDSNFHFNLIFIDCERLKNTYGIDPIFSILNKEKYPSISKQIKFDFSKISYMSAKTS